jgi:serine/threonine protein kinase
LKEIAHADAPLSPSPVFLDDSRENVKLGDFGLSKALGAATFANTYVGTPYYMSPELFSESSYDSKSDIWALGCVIYEMVALQYVCLASSRPTFR